MNGDALNHYFHAACARNLPPFIGSWIEEGRDDVAVPVLMVIAAANMAVRWGLRNGMWVFGADSFADLIRKVKDYLSTASPIRSWLPP
jgi:hypothetical protein